jgi:choline dehydrogenase-like flavoprotein
VLIDAEQLASGSLIAGEVIIAGAGLAGIALARQLADAGHDVVVLESGGEKPDPRIQQLYAGRMTLGGPGSAPRELDTYLIDSRLRCLGGSGNIWGGKCGPLDPVDFEKRDWIPWSGWPLSRRDMQPYYDRACALLDLPKFDAANGGLAGIREGLFEERSASFTPRSRCYTRMTGLAGQGHYDGYRKSATSHPRVRVHLHANVTRIQLNEDGNRVESLEVRCLDGRRHQARARAYVLAMGGIENVRLLLVSDDVQRTGIGNHSDWLGRAFAGHTTVSHPDTPLVTLTRRADAVAAYNPDARDRPHIVIGASDAAQRQMKTANFTTTLTRAPQEIPATARAVHAIAARLSGQREPGLQRTSASSPPRSAHLGAYFMLEQTPNRDSRIALTHERDELGVRRVRVDMRYNAIELDTLRTMASALARELGRLEAGRMRWPGQPTDVVSLMSLSRHHMGATRMSVTPREGVVDAHCRVHGVSNLHVAGSSVFPTGGITNPSLTLLALGYRLGDRLDAVLKGRA